MVSDEHSFADVDEVDGRYVLVCTCGWRSPPEVTAQATCEHWDRHRGDITTNGAAPPGA